LPNIVVLYHSGYGHTQRLAQAVAEGAQATLVAIDPGGNLPQGGWEELKAADAIIFGSPTYMGGVSWQFKKFADASSKPWYAQEWKDKVAAGFTTSSGMDGDKSGAIAALFTLAMQHGMVWVGQGLLPSNTRAASRGDLNYLAAYSGAMAQTPSDAGAEHMSAGDLEAGRVLGRRVAQVAAKLGA
jgi:NAD(P)H dehydrogenase (quinone)